MTGTFNGKTIAWVGIPVLLAASLAILNTVSQGMLFEIRKSTAALEEAKASNKAAEAQALDAINKLKGTLETAAAMNNVGQLQANATMAAANQVAQATITAAKTAGESLVAATQINMHPENEAYDSVTGPLIGEPAKKMADLNKQIVRLEREIQTGIDSSTRRTLTKDERINRWGNQVGLQEELETLKQTTQKNWQDATRMVFGAFNETLGGLAGLYPTGKEPVPARRIVQEP